MRISARKKRFRPNSLLPKSIGLQTVNEPLDGDNGAIQSRSGPPGVPLNIFPGGPGPPGIPIELIHEKPTPVVIKGDELEELAGRKAIGEELTLGDHIHLRLRRRIGAGTGSNLATALSSMRVTADGMLKPLPENPSSATRMNVASTFGSRRGSGTAEKNVKAYCSDIHRGYTSCSVGSTDPSFVSRLHKALRNITSKSEGRL